MMTDSELRQFKLLYGRRTDLELAKHFNIQVSDVEELAKQHCLGKDKQTFAKVPTYRVMMPRWNEESVHTLRKIYPHKSTLEVARCLGRSVKSVSSKAHQLGLVKTPELLQAMGRENISKRNFAKKNR